MINNRRGLGARMSQSLGNRVRPMRRVLLLGFVLTLGGCGTVPPVPVVPDGSSRVPVNTEPRVQAFKTRIATEQQRSDEQRRLEREVEDLRTQVQQLRTAAILLAQDAEGKRDSPLARPESSLTPAHRSALAGLAPSAQLVLAPKPQVLVPVQSADADIEVQPRSAGSPARLQVVPTSAPVQPQNTAPHTRADVADRSAPTPVAFNKRTSIPESAPTKPLETASDIAPPIANTPASAPTLALTFRILLPERRTSFELPVNTAIELVRAARASRQIIIRARTSADADDPDNRELARERAAQARAFLIERGIGPDRIWINALGAGGHATQNRTAQGRALNSRVDIELFDLDRNAIPNADPSQPPGEVKSPALAVRSSPGAAP